MDTVGLDRSLADRYPSQLSGGQQQRVGVARGLAVDPNILLMDEPFGAVDPIVRDDLQNELLRLQRDLDKTVVFVTHDIDEAFLLGDQVVIFRKGGIVAQKGTPAEILANPADDFVATFVGADRGTPCAARRGDRRPVRCSSTATGAPPACSRARRTAPAVPPRQRPRPFRSRVLRRRVRTRREFSVVELRPGLESHGLATSWLAALPIVIGFVVVAPDRLGGEPLPAEPRRAADDRRHAVHDPVAAAVLRAAGADRHADPRSRSTSSSR